MGGYRRVDNIKYFHSEFFFLNILKQPNSFADHYWCNVNIKFINQTVIKILLNRLGSTGNSDIFIPRGFLCFFQNSLNIIINKKERSASRSFPGLTFFFCQDIDRTMEWSFYRPVASHSINIFFPIMFAPIRLNVFSIISLSEFFVSPPSNFKCWRKVFCLNIQSCILISLSTSGFFAPPFSCYFC